MIKIFVDGASRGNPGPGGSGVVIFDTKNNKILYKYSISYENTTNNQAELKALIHALDLTQQKYSDEFCTIYSDSAYCVNMCNSWIHNWARNGWLNSKKQQVENYELVRYIYKFVSKNEPNFIIEKIPGHAGIIGNELADALASGNDKKYNSIITTNNIEDVSPMDIIEIFKNI